MNRRQHQRSERGAITLAVSLLAVGFLILGGLVIDGGRQMNARLQARAVAEEAARSGATQTDVNARDAAIVPENAQVAIGDYCAVAAANDPDIVDCGYTGSGEYGGTGVGSRTFPWVEVTVTVRTDTALLGLIGVGTMESTVSARANTVEGIVDPLADPGLPTLDPTPEPTTETPSWPTESGDPTLTTDIPRTPTEYVTPVPPRCQPPFTTWLPTDTAVTCLATPVTETTGWTTTTVPLNPPTQPTPRPGPPPGKGTEYPAQIPPSCRPPMKEWMPTDQQIECSPQTTVTTDWNPTTTTMTPHTTAEPPTDY